MFTPEQLKKYVTSAKADWESRFGTMYDEWANIANAIRTKTPGTPAWRSNIFIPLVPMYIDEQLPKDVETLIGSGNFFSVKAVDKKDEDTAQCYQKLMSFYLEQNQAYLAYSDAIRDANRFPLGWVKQFWDYSVDTKSYYDVKEGKKVEVKGNIITDEPKVQYVPFNRVFPDPCSRNKNTLNYVVEEFGLSIAELEKLKDQKWAISANINAYISAHQEVDKYQPITCYAFYGKTEVAWLLDDYTVIRHTLNPLKSNSVNFYPVVKIPVPGQLYGKGLCQVLGDLNKWVNLVENMKNDNLMLVINKIYQKKRSTDYNPAQFQLDPGNIIEYTSEDEKLQEVPMGTVNPGAFAELSRIVAVMDRMVGAASGVTATATLAQENNDTATGAIILAEENARRSAIFAKYNKEYFLKPQLRDLIEMIQQYTTKESAIKILGPELGKKWIPEPVDVDILTKYNIIITGEDTTYSKQLELKKLELGVGMLSKIGAELDKTVIAQRIVALTGVPKEVLVDEPKKTDTSKPAVPAPANVQPELNPEQLAQASALLGESPEQVIAFVKDNGVQALADKIKAKVAQTPNTAV